MGMADLMNFVKDLIEMEEKKKNGKICKFFSATTKLVPFGNFK